MKKETEFLTPRVSQGIAALDNLKDTYSESAARLQDKAKTCEELIRRVKASEITIDEAFDLAAKR